MRAEEIQLQRVVGFARVARSGLDIDGELTTTPDGLGAGRVQKIPAMRR